MNTENSSSPPAGIKVLIVDDDDAVRDSLELYLKTKKWQTLTAESAAEALERIKSENVSIVITDVRMPGMDGILLTQAIHEFNPDIEVLIITGFSSENLAIDALKAGAIDYFRKPLQPEKILRALEKTKPVREYRQQQIPAAVYLG